MTPADRPSPVRWIQWTLAVVGIALLGWAGAGWAERAWYRAHERRAIAVAVPAPASDPTSALAADVADPRAFAGFIEVPRIGLSEAFAEGDDDATLRKAIGHLSDTPFPWQQGNSAFAGHRDQHFRPLKNIAVGDEIRVVMPHGILTYRVTHTYIVTPKDVWVLAQSSDRELTLITCYPFAFIGHAPQRFVVRAEPESDFVERVAFAR